MIGQLISNRYRIDAELGRGGMGAVYRAHDMVLGRDVALKMLKSVGLNSETRARFLREARATARLNHPNIVGVYDVGEAELPEREESTPFIVLELVEGQSLHEIRPTELDQIVGIARQICTALGHAHSHGLVHRDLKPENIMVTPDGTVKLTDLGLAGSVASRVTSEGTVLGTVFYMAPEYALGQAFDGRADLYALGVLLYELTTGRLPFVADDPVAIISQHLYAPVVPPRAHNDKIPPTLDALIVQLMSKRPEDRPTSALEVQRVLEGLNSAEPTAQATVELLLLDRIVYTHIVGREHELTEATALWGRVLGGEAQVLLVSGEPGIGKTRMVREFATRVEVMGGQVLTGECYAEGGAPYAPIAQMIRHLESQAPARLAALPIPVLVDLLTLAPDLRPRYPDLPPNPQLDPQSQQRRVFESAVAFFTSMAQEAPLLLFVDDAHWADNGTLSLLRHTARRMRNQRLGIVLTYRESELDQARALNEVLNDLNRERLATRIKLSRLSREQTSELLAGMLAEDVSPDLLRGVYRETEGNPFFVEEVCKALVEDGALYFADGHWQQARSDEMEIPQSVRVAIQSRVSKLPEAVQETMRLAAILGREFDFELLKATSELDEETLIEALETAERVQLIGEVNRGGREGFSFVHALVPSTLRESLSGLRRHRLHRRVAAALETVRPDDYEALAYHYGEAGDEKQSRTFYIQAGDRARGLVALDDATRHYSAALKYWPEEEDRTERANVLSRLGECKWVTGDLQGALVTLQSAYTLLEGMGNRVQAGDVMRMMGRLYWELADRQAAMAYYRQALAMLEQGPETVELARAISAISQAYMIMIDFDPAIEWGERALALAQRLGAQDVILHAMNNIGTSRTLMHNREPERGLEMVRDSLRLARGFDLPYEIGRALYNMGESLFGLGRYDEARANFEELYAYGSRIRSQLFTGLGLRLLIELDWRQGHWSSALARREVALEVTEGSVAVWQASIFSEINNDLGQYEAARQDMETMLAQITRLEQIQTIVPCLGQLLRAYIGLGMEAEAEQTARQLTGMVDANAYLHWFCDMPILYACRWYARSSGTAEASIACLKRLERAHAQMHSPRTAASLAESRVLTDLVAGDWAAAVEHGQAAVAAWEGLGHPYDCSRVLGDLARAYEGAGEPEAAAAARSRARQLVESLAAQLEQHGPKDTILVVG